MKRTCTALLALVAVASCSASHGSSEPGTTTTTRSTAAIVETVFKGYGLDVTMRHPSSWSVNAQATRIHYFVTMGHLIAHGVRVWVVAGNGPGGAPGLAQLQGVRTTVSGYPAVRRKFSNDSCAQQLGRGAASVAFSVQPPGDAPQVLLAGCVGSGTAQRSQIAMVEGLLKSASIRDDASAHGGDLDPD
jgi:hypothetical protein